MIESNQQCANGGVETIEFDQLWAMPREERNGLRAMRDDQNSRHLVPTETPWLAIIGSMCMGAQLAKCQGSKPQDIDPFYLIAIPFPAKAAS
jgi:hypothetical protein